MSEPEAPATIHELRMRMRQLHEKSGAPTAAAMRMAIKDFSAPRLAPASLSEFFSDKRPNALPRQDFLRGFVAACLLYRGDDPGTVTAQLRTWDTWWAALVLASGTPPITITARPPAADPPATDNPPRRRRTLPIIAGAVAGFALGLATAAIIPVLFRPHAIPQQLIIQRPSRTSPTDPCPVQRATMRDGGGDAVGSIQFLECDDYLDVLISDNHADDLCISAVITWTTGQSETTGRTCPADGMTRHLIRRRTADYTLTLVSGR